MKSTLIVIASLAGCALRDPRTTGTAGAPCSTTAQCGRNICFLGECRAPAANLSQVLVALQPPSGPLATQERQIDLRTSPPYDFALQPLYSGPGTVKQDDLTGSTPVQGATVSFIDRAPLIVDRVDQFDFVTDASGTFTARVPPGSWSVLVVPPPPSPPYRTIFDTATPNLDIHLPGPAQTVAIALALQDGGTFPAAGVTAIDTDAGDPISATALAQADGGYTVRLPPATPAYLLQVGPAPTPDGGTPSATPVVPTYAPMQPPPAGQALKLPLPPEVTLSGTVVDQNGAPISTAGVYTRSDPSQPWTLSRSTTADGGTFSMTVLAGTYSIEAAPATGDPAAISGITPSLTVPGSAPTLRCPPKVLRSMKVSTYDGGPAGPGYQVTATRKPDALLSSRVASTTQTDGSGVFHISADPGVYRVEIVPPASTGLPRKLISIDLPANDTSGLEQALPEISLSAPLNVVGIVSGRLSPGASSTTVSGATLSFFALDSQGHSVLLGSALTDSNGQYKAILPDVQNPGP